MEATAKWKLALGATSRSSGSAHRFVTEPSGDDWKHCHITNIK